MNMMIDPLPTPAVQKKYVRPVQCIVSAPAVGCGVAKTTKVA
jgi:hypothetical protein